jgi:hypothetical protein
VPNLRNTLAIGVAVAIFGCGSADDEHGAEKPLANAVTVSNSGDVEPITMEDRTIADKAVRALADHLDIPVSAITVDSVRAIEWSDSSIGCPQPGQAYLQVITPGHRISLRVGEKLYTVNEANGRAFVCTRKKPAVSSLTNELELVWAEQAAIARDDLAGRLGVDPSQIIVSSARGTTWTDTGAEYETTRSEGFVITLRHGSRNYTYHTDLERVIACPPITDD